MIYAILVFFLMLLAALVIGGVLHSAGRADGRMENFPEPHIEPNDFMECDHIWRCDAPNFSTCVRCGKEKIS